MDKQWENLSIVEAKGQHVAVALDSFGLIAGCFLDSVIEKV